MTQFRDEPTGEAEEGKEPSTDEASSKTKQRRQDPKEVKRLKRKYAFAMFIHILNILT